MARETCSRRVKAAAAFTLVELLLTVALVLLLAGAVIINFGSLDRNARLEEGASHLETLFRYARAQAASTGRRVRIVFDSGGLVAGLTNNSTNGAPITGGTNAEARVFWEPEPVDAPGRFEPLPGAELLVEQVNDLVTVREVHRRGARRDSAETVSTASLPDLQTETLTNDVPQVDTTTAPPPSLTCYPDGSSDSMELVLAAVNGEDRRLAVVTLQGLNGRAHHRLITPLEDGTLPTDEKARAGSRRRNP